MSSGPEIKMCGHACVTVDSRVGSVIKYDVLFNIRRPFTERAPRALSADMRPGPSGVRGGNLRAGALLLSKVGYGSQGGSCLHGLTWCSSDEEPSSE